jgi:hypothetical protein
MIATICEKGRQAESKSCLFANWDVINGLNGPGETGDLYRVNHLDH